MPGPTVVQLPTGNLNDIAALIRQVADDIESGQYGKIVSGAAIALNEEGAPVVFGWGRTDDIHSIGLFHLGASWLASHKVVR